MNTQRLLVTSSLLLASSLALPAPSLASSLTCELVEPGFVTVDGLLDDWRGIRHQDVGGKDRDASFSLRCAYDHEHLHIAVDVRDDYLHRTRRPRPASDDGIVIELGVASSPREALRVFPGTDKLGSARSFNGKAVPRWLTVEDTQQRHGWSLEVSIPLARIRGYGKAAPGLNARVVYSDADFAGKVKARRVFDGMLELQASAALYRSFLQATRLKRKDIRLDQLANVDDSPGPERVVAGRNIIGVLGEQYIFMELPVASPADVRRIELADLRGDGTMSIITELRQHGNGGSRDLVAVWQVAGTSFERLLAFETRKERDGKVLANRWSLVPRGAHRAGAARTRGGRGHDILIEVSESDVSGWDAATFREIPAGDAAPILTPWSDQTSAVYYFEGNAALGGEPRATPRGRKRPR